MSNSKSVLSDCPTEDLAAGVSLPSKGPPLYKTQVVYWDAASDLLRVKINIKKKPCTRSGLMSMVGQTCDFLGVLQPFLLPAMQLF